MKGDDGCHIQTSSVQPNVTATPMAPWDKVSEPWKNVTSSLNARVKALSLLNAGWTRIRALTDSLLIMRVSLDEPLCRILSDNRSHCFSYYFLQQLQFIFKKWVMLNTEQPCFVLVYLLLCSLQQLLVCMEKKTKKTTVSDPRVSRLKLLKKEKKKNTHMLHVKLWTVRLQ